MENSPEDREETRTGYGEEEEEGVSGPEDVEVDTDAEGGLDALHPEGAPGGRCDLCGGPVEERHCKIVCLNCGYQRDCSDP